MFCMICCVLGVFVVFVVVVFVFSVCFFGLVGVEFGGDVILSYVIWDENQKFVMEDIVVVFIKEYLNVMIDIQVMLYKEYFIKLQIVVMGGFVVDVFWMNGLNFQFYVLNGQFVLFDDGSIDVGDYLEGLIDFYIYDGKLYGVLKDFDIVVFWYNKVLFDVVGVEYFFVDWMWEDFMVVVVKFIDFVKGQFGVVVSQYGQENFYNLIVQVGGEVIFVDGMKSGYGLLEVFVGIELWIDLIVVGFLFMVQQMIDMNFEDFFFFGKVVMFQNGLWVVIVYVDNVDIGGSVDVVLFFVGVEGNQSVIYGVGNVVNVKSVYFVEVKQFVVFVFGEQVVKIQVEIGIVIFVFDGMQQVWVDVLLQYDLQVYIDVFENVVFYLVLKNILVWMSIESEVFLQVWLGVVLLKEGFQDFVVQMQVVLDVEQE